MNNRFLISVAAAALIAGTGFANAQGMNREGGGAAGGSTVQQSAPSERGAPSAAPMNRDSSPSGTKAGEPGGMKGAQTDKAGAPAAKQADDGMKGQKSQNTASDAEQPKGGKDMKAEGRDSGKMNNAQSKEGMSKDGMSKDSTTNAQTKSGTDRSQTTTGNAATSATAAPPAEKRSQIVSGFKQERITETTNVNFNISVGATVPGSVRFHPIPARIVEIYPEWSGYEVILVHGRYVIVRPQTHEIVYIIEG